MSHYHAVVWIDHQKATAWHFTSTEQAGSVIHAHDQHQRVHSRKSAHGGHKSPADRHFFDDVAHALEGAHEKVACSSCHETRRDPGTRTVTLAPARGTDCAACHADPHVGQFAAGGRTDCARCHTSTESFQKIAFDHDRDSRFHLDEGHKKLACAACHVRVPLEGGESAVRYKPLGTSCGDCHDPGGRRPR
jgi:hypothetical protein